MLQGFFGSDALLGIVDEYSPKEIEELLVKFGVAGYGFLISLEESCCGGRRTYMKLLHCLDVFLRRLVGLRVRIIKFVVLEMSCSTMGC